MNENEMNEMKFIYTEELKVDAYEAVVKNETKILCISLFSEEDDYFFVEQYMN